MISAVAFKFICIIFIYSFGKGEGYLIKTVTKLLELLNMYLSSKQPDCIPFLHVQKESLLEMWDSVMSISRCT